MRPLKLKTDRYKYLKSASSNISSRPENKVEEWWPKDRHGWEQLETMQDDETISSYISEQLTNNEVNEDNDEELISQLLCFLSQGTVPHSHCPADENLQRIAPIVEMIEAKDGTKSHLEVNFTPCSSEQPLSILGVAEDIDRSDSQSVRDDFEDDCSDHERRKCGGIFCIASPAVLVSSKKMIHNLSSRSRQQFSRSGRCATSAASQPLLSKQKSSSVIQL